MSEDGFAAISDWVVEAGLGGVHETKILDGMCRRLNDIGTAVMRVQMGQRILHPVYGGTGILWLRSKGAEQVDWERAEANVSDGLDNSPFGYLFQNNALEWRYRIEGANEPAPYPIIEDLRNEGATDYIALATGFEDTSEKGVSIENQEGMMSTWTVDNPGGYSDAQLDALRRLVKTFGLAIKSAKNLRMARTLLEVYLGKDAGRRVLSGEIELGSVQTISAVLWYCDMQGFTKIAERTSSSDLIDMLNAYFDTLVSSIHAAGGEVLKFMGDGLMAIFKLDDKDTRDVCRVALDTVEDVRRRIAEINQVRNASEKVTTDLYIAVHLGDVEYGNIGAKDRLDFTVVGPAVNKVSRIEAMCRPLERDIVISSAFARAAVDCQDRMVSLGRYALRGVEQPEELYTLMPPSQAP